MKALQAQFVRLPVAAAFQRHSYDAMARALPNDLIHRVDDTPQAILSPDWDAKELAATFQLASGLLDSQQEIGATEAGLSFVNFRPRSFSMAQRLGPVVSPESDGFWALMLFMRTVSESLNPSDGLQSVCEWAFLSATISALTDPDE